MPRSKSYMKYQKKIGGQSTGGNVPGRDPLPAAPIRLWIADIANADHFPFDRKWHQAASTAADASCPKLSDKPDTTAIASLKGRFPDPTADTPKCHLTEHC